MYCGIDLGTTNIKAALYNEAFQLIDRQSRPVTYIRENGFVEFDAIVYVHTLLELLSDMLKQHNITSLKHITLTGQAETLVVLDHEGTPLIHAISWMDERSVQECNELASQFDAKTCEDVTGQMAVLPTWPATKILWLKKNRPEVFVKVSTYMLLKDYVVYALTGVKLADMSIATFSFYFDIYKKVYWQEMLQAIGISENQLPPLCEPCTIAGKLLPVVAEKLGLCNCVSVNTGTLDHFAGMIGTGNIQPGGLTLSTGTVMAIATQCPEPAPKGTGIAMHYGFLPDTRVMLPVVESGGVSLEWFKRSCMQTISYDEINAALACRDENELLFLPYIVGTNAPEFDSEAKGVFWGLRQEHDAIDMAGAIMEGVAYVLRKNCAHITATGMTLSRIIATGGGSASDIWCQLYADITGLPLLVPAEKEAACLGAAMIGAVADGCFASFHEAANVIVSFCKTFTPRTNAHYERKYRRFCKLYESALSINEIQ